MRTHTNKWLKRIMMAFVAVIALFSLSGCTKSFCTNQDKANQMFAAIGNIFNDSVNITDEDNYSDDFTFNEETQNTNRENLYNVMKNAGYNLPSKTFNAFMDKKAREFVDDNYVKFIDGTIDDFTVAEVLPELSSASETDQQVALNNYAKEVAWHVAIYAGIDENNQVTSLWTNYNTWYQEAVDELGVLVVPTQNFVTAFQTNAQSFIASNAACITPVDGTFVQNGSTIYIEGKTWGQAFSEFGFLEGLFVYPFSWLVHAISNSISNSDGWAQILAIVIVTLIARIFTVISTFLQSKSTARQQLIQPKLNALQAKYPKANEDREQKQALAMEQARLMKQAKIHPFVPLLFMILQFPLFICVWSALQGSAALASESWLGLSLTTPVSQCFTNFANTPGAVTGICIFIFMTIANILSSCTGLWFNTWRQKKFGNAMQPAEGAPNPNKTMKYMTYGMLVVIVIMGWSLPAGMGIYWFTGAIISILQSLLNETMQRRHRQKMLSATGDGTQLATLRRSAHHQNTINPNKTKSKKTKSDKAMWR